MTCPQKNGSDLREDGGLLPRRAAQAVMKSECLPDGPEPQGSSLQQGARQGGAQLLDSALGLLALGLTLRAVLSTAGPALLLLLLLVSFLTFDLLHRPAGPSLPRHRLLMRGQSQGAGEGPGRPAATLRPTGASPAPLSRQDALLLLLLTLGLLLGARGLSLALLGLAFCLHPWA